MIVDRTSPQGANEAGAREALSRDRLWVSRLQLSNFRNYEALRLEIGPAPVILVGANGAGKTNLLEAASLLSAGQGLRGAAYAELGRRPAAPAAGSPWAVSACLHGGERTMAIGTGLSPGRNGGGRVVRIDGEPAGGSGALADFIRMTWLTPAMDGLFTGPASERRRFLDRMTLSFDPSYRRAAGRFDRAMRQRNRLLETGERAAGLFAGLERQMAEAGVAVAAARVDAVERLRAGVAAQDHGRQGADPAAFPWAVLSVDGDLEAALRHTPAPEVEENYVKRLSESRDRDRLLKRTLLGPHRSDLSVGHGPKAAPARQCSTGEQKALLLGLVLAHGRAVKQINAGLAPLILLDEIVAHLDEARRLALFRELEGLGAQVWMTGTDESVFSALRGRAQILRVAGGEATPAFESQRP